MAPELRPRPGRRTLKGKYGSRHTAVRRAAASSSSSDTRLPRPQYQQLDLGKREIRILRLLPGNPTAPIACELYTAILDDGPRYEALSYAWGLPHFTHSVILNGKAAAITANLYNALRRLRRRHYDRHLWVDALCINQTDDDEKSHQVNLMKEIYSRTMQATLWLGDFSDAPTRSSSSSRRSLRPGGRLELNASLAANTIPRDIAMVAFDYLNSMAGNDHLNDKNDLETTKKNLTALDTMLRLPWWHRIWTVQEAVLPGKAVIQCGAAKMSLCTLFSACNNSSAHFFGGCCSNCEDFIFLLNFWDKAQSILFLKESTPSVWRVVCAFNLFRNRQASDPRDRVYALTGLGSTLPVDYSLSHEEVYKRSVRSLVVQSGGLEPLLRVSEDHRSSSLPTWVPDLCSTGPSLSRVESQMAWLQIYQNFDASLKTRTTTRNPASDQVLDLEGFTIDEIVTLGDCFSGVYNAPHVVTRWEDMVSAHCAVHGEDYPRKGTYHEAFSWTALAGNTLSMSGSNALHHHRVTADDDVDARDIWNSYALSTKTLVQLWKDTRIFLTRDGLLGLGQKDIQVGDSVHVLLGGKMPFILRAIAPSSRDSTRQFHYIGHAYVHGIMDGEVLYDGREREVINLV